MTERVLQHGCNKCQNDCQNIDNVNLTRAFSVNLDNDTIAFWLRKESKFRRV